MVNAIPDLMRLFARHDLLTPLNVAMRQIFPWAHSIQKILHAVQPMPFHGRQLFVGSDYSGSHKGSTYHTYAYLIVSDAATSWVSSQKDIRRKYLENARRMSFKRLGDSQRWAALCPFLQAADMLDGHLVVFVVQKAIRLHPSRSHQDVEKWRQHIGLTAKWNHRSLGDAIRKAHFFALLVSQWSEPLMSVTWISDQDDFVGNAKRLDDAQKLAAKLSTLYLPHPLLEFAMNTTAVDGPSHEFEDFVAIADLAAGMLSELSNTLSKGSTWTAKDGRGELEEGDVQLKSEVIVDWFWCPNARLRRTCIVIDRFGQGSRVFRLDKQDACSLSLLLPQ